MLTVIHQQLTIFNSEQAQSIYAEFTVSNFGPIVDYKSTGEQLVLLRLRLFMQLKLRL